MYENVNKQKNEKVHMILADIDELDYEDKHYKRRKVDLEDRLYKAYDKMDEIENAFQVRRQRNVLLWLIK